MIYKSNNNLTFVVYENQKPAKCFEIKKGLVKFLIFFLPLVSMVILLSFLFAFSYLKNVTMELRDEEPLVIKKLRDKEQSLIKEKNELTSFNKELINKINQKQTSYISIPFFSLSQGFQDLSDQDAAIIETTNFFIDKEGRPSFHFNIVNNRNDTKRLSGHVGVILKAGTILSVYPKPQELDQNEPLNLTFNMGEHFSVSRFRTVEATFDLPANALTKLPVFFDVFIFSRTGDLIFKKTFGPIKPTSPSV